MTEKKDRNLNPSNCRLMILYNQPILAPDHPDFDSEYEILETVQIIEDHLKDSGFQLERYALGRDLDPFIQRLKKNPPSVVLNLFEGFGDFSESEVYLAGLLEWEKIPYTGSAPQALLIGRNKLLCKSVLQAAGVASPGFFQVSSLPVPQNSLGWPVIVKPATTDASIGIDQGSVVLSQNELDARVKMILERFGPPVLVEQFVDGREFTIAVVEDSEVRIMSPSEIHFPIREKGLWPIISYDAKWKPDSVEFDGTPYEYPAKTTPELLAKIRLTAGNAFKAVGLRDYGRIDLRVSNDEKVYVIEVNPNSDLHIVAGLAISLESIGLTYSQFLKNLVLGAWARAG